MVRMPLAAVAILFFTGFAFAKKIDCSDKARDYTYTVQKKCKMLTVKAWGGGAAGKGKHGLGGAFAMSDFEIPAGGVLQIHLGAGGKAGQDGETTTVNFGQAQLILARGGEASEENSCAAFPGFQRGMSHFDYPKDSNPAGGNDSDLIKANRGAPKGKGYAYGVDGEQGMCGYVAIKCLDKVPTDKKDAKPSDKASGGK